MAVIRLDWKPAEDAIPNQPVTFDIISDVVELNDNQANFKCGIVVVMDQTAKDYMVSKGVNLTVEYKIAEHWVQLSELSGLQDSKTGNLYFPAEGLRMDVVGSGNETHDNTNAGQVTLFVSQGA